jgi:hypothetical protein
LEPAVPPVISLPDEKDETVSSGDFRVRFQLVPTILGTALILAIAGAVVFGSLYSAEMKSVARVKSSLAAERGKVASAQETNQRLANKLAGEQSTVDAAEGANSQIASLKTQLAACIAAAGDYGAQAIADGMIAINPGGDNTVNLNIATTEQTAGNATGCLPSS